MIRLQGVTKVYHAGDVPVPALRGIDLEIERGEFLAIIGASGSGKSTLMHILGCLDRPTRGSYQFEDHDVLRMTDAQLARIRSHRIGFVFQSFNLISRWPAVAQVELPLIYRGANNRRRRAMRALTEVRLRDRAREALGARFDVRAFHDKLLDGGALPLDVLGERVKAWIEGQA